MKYKLDKPVHAMIGHREISMQHRMAKWEIHRG